MPWETSARRSELPRDWATIRRRILARDPICRLALEVCTGRSNEVDHVGDKHDHSDHNLRGVCTPCHKRRTQEQAQAAKPRQRRATESHPGLL